MADSDKNILITPNRGSTTADPKIEFTGGDNNTVTLSTLDDGTLSFSGSSGQLFSISDSLTGTIFSVNDVSGIPSIEVEDTGDIRLAEFAGSVNLGEDRSDLANPADFKVRGGNGLFVSGVGTRPTSTTDPGVYIGGTSAKGSSGNALIRLQGGLLDGANKYNPRIEFSATGSNTDASIYTNGSNSLYLTAGAVYLNATDVYLGSSGSRLEAGSELSWIESSWSADAYTNYVFFHTLSSYGGANPVVYRWVMTNGTASGTYNAVLELRKKRGGYRYNDISDYEISSKGYNPNWNVRIAYNDNNTVSIGVYPSYRPPGYIIYAKLGYDRNAAYIGSSYGPNTSQPYSSSSSLVIGSSNGYDSDEVIMAKQNARNLYDVSANFINKLEVDTAFDDINPPTTGYVLSWDGTKCTWVEGGSGGGGGGSSTPDWLTILDDPAATNNTTILWNANYSSSDPLIFYGGVIDNNSMDPGYTMCCWYNLQSGNPKIWEGSYPQGPGIQASYSSSPAETTQFLASVNPMAYGKSQSGTVTNGGSYGGTQYFCPPGVSSTQKVFFVVYVMGTVDDMNVQMNSYGGNNFEVATFNSQNSQQNHSIIYGTSDGTGCINVSWGISAPYSYISWFVY